MRERNRARKIWQHTRNPSDKRILNTLQNKIHRKVHAFQSKLWADDLRSLDPDDGSLWEMSEGLRKKKSPVYALNGRAGIAHTDSDKAEVIACSLDSLSIFRSKLPTKGFSSQFVSMNSGKDRMKKGDPSFPTTLDPDDGSLWEMSEGLRKKKSPVYALNGRAGIAHTDSDQAEVIACSLESQFQDNNISSDTDYLTNRVVEHYFLNENNFDAPYPLSSWK
ncbi:hypothetical protein TNCV_1591111 [Trichonephila clavipes]|nr:hypothetical protein TNCV_1591111 [Trichonephila clavipes]